MRTMTRSALLLLLLSVVASPLLWPRSAPAPAPAPPPPDDARRSRVHQLLLHDPGLTPARAEALVDASDCIGEVDVSRRMAELELTDAERRAFFEENAELFGGRSYRQSARTVDALLRIRIVREELGLAEVTPAY